MVPIPYKYPEIEYPPIAFSSQNRIFEHVTNTCKEDTMRHQNWHPADIIAALKKHGTSLAALSRKAGLSSSALANALT
jgi:Predicted transcriptional regulator